MLITEPTSKENTKSIGCYFIEDRIRKAGYNIQYIDFDKLKDYDLSFVLFSVHHVKDIFYINKILKYKKKSDIWIGGGHVMNNPYPFLHFFDLICVGEGEEWILKVLELYKGCPEKNKFIEKATGIEGSMSLLNYKESVKKIYIDDISINDMYLNKSFALGHKDTWYIETARGCKSKCLYCELGWTSKYRENNRQKVMNYLDMIKDSDCKRVNIFAPDDFSCSFYEMCIDKIIKNKLITNFGSMRVDRFKNMDIKVKKNFLFRMGIDGLSEWIRELIHKRITNDEIFELITKLADEGFVMFKLFMIFSYPFEAENDFKEFENLLYRIQCHLTNYNRPIFLRLKFTPFIPNPLTPLENFIPDYNREMRIQIENFFMKQKMNRSNIVFINDGILEPFSYYTQCYLAKCGYENLNIEELKNKKIFNFVTEEYCKELKFDNKIVTMFDKSHRDKVFSRLKNYV